MTELESNFVLTKDTPYLAPKGEVWGVFRELLKKWPRYIESALYYACLGEQWPCLTGSDCNKCLTNRLKGFFVCTSLTVMLQGKWRENLIRIIWQSRSYYQECISTQIRCLTLNNSLPEYSQWFCSFFFCCKIYVYQKGLLQVKYLTFYKNIFV